jgi:hypothetical protein
MFRNILMLSLAVLLVGGVAVAGNEAGTAWFDMANCVMCKNVVAEKDMMDNMSWEHHAIKNGVVSVTTVAPDYLDTYRKVSMKMHETGMKMQKGEIEPKTCGSCTALGMCMMKGLAMEPVQTSVGSIMLFTSDNPEVVKEIQAWAKRNAEEMAKMKMEG